MQNSLIQWFATRFLDRALQPHELMRARKVVYIFLILVLFFGSYFWRTLAIEAQAKKLAVQEESHGDVELDEAVIRLSLTGLRGVATCYIWVTAMEKQKKHQWNELDFYVRAMTKLQPHFVTPWLFQGWNLSYNVSVEADRIGDKYFYISRGTQLLTEGERRNRHNPNLRWSIGFTQQHKIMQSDETNVLRSLYQLSCIPPNRRDPARFYKRDSTGERVFNWVEFERFCKENPKLVRRLRTGIRRATSREYERQFTCETPEAVVQFLEDNWRLPSQYEQGDPTPEGASWQEANNKLIAVEERFPTLPPNRNPPEPQKPFEPAFDFQELTNESQLNDDIDAFIVARAWYGYAQEPVPAPSKWPGLPEKITSKLYQGKPKMTTLIFRSYPALAQSLHATSLQNEGWFDDSPWQIRGWFSSQQDEFVGEGGESEPAELRVSKEQSSLKGWADAARMWQKHGDVNHLLFDNPVDAIEMNRLAEQYWTKFGMSRYSAPLVPPDEEDTLPVEDRETAKAARYLYEYKAYRDVSNFPHHYHKANVEALEATVTARQLFFKGHNERLQGSPDDALRTYESDDALIAWRDKVLAWPELDRHREYREDDDIQQFSFETQYEYLRLKNEWEIQPIKEKLAEGLLRFSALPQSTVARSGVGLNFVNPYLAMYLLQRGQALPTLELVREPFAVPVLEEFEYPRFASSLVGTVGSPILPTPLMSVLSLTAGNRPLIREDISRQILIQKGVIKPEEAEDETETEDENGDS